MYSVADILIYIGRQSWIPHFGTPSHGVLEWKAARNQTAKATKLGIDTGILQPLSRKIEKTNSLSRYFFPSLLYLSVGLSGTWTTSHPTFTPDLGEVIGSFTKRRSSKSYTTF
jgi:hypothetical protein